LKKKEDEKMNSDKICPALLRVFNLLVVVLTGYVGSQKH